MCSSSPSTCVSCLSYSLPCHDFKLPLGSRCKISQPKTWLSGSGERAHMSPRLEQTSSLIERRPNLGPFSQGCQRSRYNICQQGT